MAVKKSTLIDVTNDGTIYVYPRTSADIVQYEDEISVKDKIEDILEKISELNAKKIITISADDVVSSNTNIYELEDININKINLNMNIVENYNSEQITLETITIEHDQGGVYVGS